MQQILEPELEHTGGAARPPDAQVHPPAGPRRGRKALVIGLLSVFVAVAGWSLLHGSGGVQYRTAAVERGPLNSTVSATGNLNAVVTVQVGSQVSGNILALNADYNTRVTKGQLVARIDPQVFQAKVDQSTATLNASRAAVANAQAAIQKANADVSTALASVAEMRANELKAEAAQQNARTNMAREEELFKSGIVSRQDYENAQLTLQTSQAGVDAAKAQQQAANDNVNAARATLQSVRTQEASAEATVKQNEAGLAQAQLDLAHTYITAPVDGVVVARNVDVGQTVAASLQAPTLFQIAQDLTKMQVDTNVSEADVGHVQVGQPATFTVDAYPGRTFKGQVTSIRKAPINVQNVVSYDVVINVDNQDLKLFPGMTANVNILVDHRDDVLKIPNAALRFKPAEAKNAKAANTPHRKRAANEQLVWVLGADKKPHAVPVAVGITDGTNSEVTSGNLHEGDQAIVAAFSKAETKAPGGGGPRRGPGF